MSFTFAWASELKRFGSAWSGFHSKPDTAISFHKRNQYTSISVCRRDMSHNDPNRRIRYQNGRSSLAKYPDNNVHWANMGSIWGRQYPSGSHVGPMNFAILVSDHKIVYTLRPRQNGRRLAHDNFNRIFFNQKCIILINRRWNVLLMVKLTIFVHWLK